jgi:hypothetical protein
MNKNTGILRKKDASTRTELSLNTYTNVAKKMFLGIVLHHRMSLLKQEARRGK